MARRGRAIFAPRESLIQQACVDHWRALGIPGSLVACIPNARAHGQPGLTKGLADLLVLAPDLPVGFIELKRDENSVVSDEQLKFGELCAQLGIPFAVAVGRDEPIVILERWGVVRPTSHGPARRGLAPLGGAERRAAMQGTARTA
jgi:hypothetical protein